MMTDEVTPPAGWRATARSRMGSAIVWLAAWVLSFVALSIVGAFSTAGGFLVDLRMGLLAWLWTLLRPDPRMLDSEVQDPEYPWRVVVAATIVCTVGWLDLLLLLGRVYYTGGGLD